MHEQLNEYDGIVMREVAVSVVIPVYNTAPYLKRCIRSVLNQTFEWFELILVNDGSSDDSGKICDEFAVIDKRIKVFHRENSGVAAARKFGVTQAAGGYIMFSDSDDTLLPNCIRDLYSNKDKADIVVGNILIIDKITSRLFRHKVKGVLSSKEYIDALLLNNTTIGSYAKLFKKSVFPLDQWVADREIKNNEDLLMLIMLATRVESVFVDDSIICYNYFQRDNSARSNVSPTNVWFNLFSVVEGYLQNRYVEIPLSFYIYELHRLYDCCILKGNMVNVELERVQKILQKCKAAKNNELQKEDYRLYKILKSSFLQRLVYIKSSIYAIVKKTMMYILSPRQD